MHAVRRLFRQAAALALVAMLGLALAPTVSHALATQLASAQPWNELCSVDGESDAGARLAHCPLCAQPGHTPALPATPLSLGALPAASQQAPAAVPTGVVVAFVRVAPPSRAPPMVVPA
ncbi:MAG: DUF2946 family protein [Piscinibacter sp.]|uniref:DUF2946 family protein n=1 Tax=Piscinibacter sp. TaxID=1903157 RepID=UPI003D09A516